MSSLNDFRFRMSAVAVLALVFFGSCNKAAGPGGPGAGAKGVGGPVPVTVTKATQRDVPIEIQVVGNVEAYSTITVRSQTGGELKQVLFHEGDYVKENDLLFVIDKRPIEAEMNQARANLLRQEAMLKQVQANMARDIAQETYARAVSARSMQLFKAGIISKEQSDQTLTGADVASQVVQADRAAIESSRADMEATKAALENTRVKLSYTEIRSPINGRTGNLAVKLGNVVAANTTDLMTINQVQPIYVTFSVPESQLPGIKTYMAQGKLPVFAKAQEEQAAPEQGTLTFVDNAVDMNTGTIKLKGTFPNPNLRLWPGQFVRVNLRLSTQQDAVVIPNQAVQSGQEGSYVYVVKEDRTVESRKVVTGMRVEQDLVIQSGLQVGESVVLDGQLRLAPGMKVQTREPGGRGGKKKSNG